MSLLKELLRLDADRREALHTLRNEAVQRRLRIEELSAEARRKRDEIKMLEDGLSRLLEDMTRVEEELLALEKRRDEYDRETRSRKAEAVRRTFAAERSEAAKVAEEFRGTRAERNAERERLLAQAETGKMVESFFQIESFLKDASQPIPDAARKALVKERADLLARIGPLVTPPPPPDGVFRATVAYAGVDGGRPRAVVAFGLPDARETDGPADLASALVLGAYAGAVEKHGASAPRPVRRGDAVVFEAAVSAKAPEEAALDLLLAVEDGLRRAAAASSVRCELTPVYLEPEVADEALASPHAS